ncbi:MAG: leucine-rich repeat domain-containing protein [Gemmatimonadota bacterium]|nr:leucine-rich repeat domain-containing protein [Gemmatimonadota bacterium]
MPSRITITPTVVNLTALGATTQLTASVFDRNGQALSGTEVAWSSNNTGVATVSGQGLVTAVGNGTATITARSGDISAEAVVTVKQSAGRIVIEPSSATLASFGATVQLTASVLDRNGQALSGAEVAWSSNNTGVATVSGQGLVTAVGNGTATITARSGDISAEAVVTVMVMEPNPDRMVLEAFYNATDGPNWTRNDNWLSAKPLNEWFGVSTDAAGRVTDLMFFPNGLTGSIPAELGQLEHLRTLFIFSNPMTGSIPAELGQLEHLGELTLYGNQLTGSIPPELGQLEHLTILDLGYNQLTGSIPPELGRLEHLEELNLSQNRLASIPPELAQLGNLRTLDLDNNRLTGSIPPELGQLERLEILDLSWNRLTGALPPELGRLKNLVSMDFQVTELSGSIPPELGQLENLEKLELSLNLIAGSIPPELGQLKNLRILSIISYFDYRFTGPLPPELGQLENLVILDLDNNDLTGPLPPELGQLENLEALRLKHNKLSGSIPPELGRLAKLTELDLYYNQMTGTIPPELGQLENLIRLDLRSNRLSGNIPETFGDLVNLRTIFLSDNADMAGSLPLALSDLSLESLLLSGTDLCAPPEPVFLEWLRAIPVSLVARCDAGAGGLTAYLTQATQSFQNPVPLVAGEDALLRVFFAGDSEAEDTMPAVRATFFQDGAEIHVANIPARPETTIPSAIDEGDLSASANARVPGSILAPGLEMVVEIDPDGDGGLPAGMAGRLPLEGRRAVDVRDMPPLDLTLVPLLWTENPDRSILSRTESLTAESDLFRFTRDLLPVGEFTLNVREPLWTSLDPTNANKGSFVVEVAAIHALDGASGHYMGVLREESGGIADSPGKILVSGLDEATIAHELGHNMTLLHAPCGAAFQLDPLYPYGDGGTGSWGYDLLEETLLDPAVYVDIMSYCLPDWISDYHFNKAMSYRLSESAGSAQSMAAFAPSRKGLLLWGGVTDDGELYLEPAFAVDAPPSALRLDGPYRITGEDQDGGVLFSASLGMAELVCEEYGGRSFSFVLPMRPDVAYRMARITLSGPEGVATLEGQDESGAVLLTDRFTGQARGILRDWLEPGASAAAVRRILPEPGLDVVTSHGVPRPADWDR